MPNKFLSFSILSFLCLSCSVTNHTQSLYSQKLTAAEQLNIRKFESKIDVSIPSAKLNEKIEPIKVQKLAMFHAQSENYQSVIRYKGYAGISASGKKEFHQGKPTDYTQPEPAGKKVEGLGLAGFICAVVGLFVVGILLGSIGVVFGAISLSRYKKNPEKYKSKGFAIASLVVGIAAIIGAILVIVHII